MPEPLNASARPPVDAHFRLRIAGYVGVAMVLAGISWWAIDAAADTVTLSACANKRTGALRVLSDASQACRKRERALSWNQTGPEGEQGPPGAPGAPGTPGLSNGPAGGDLSGTFPNPTIRLGTSSVDAGQHTAFATACTTRLTSVTVTVPASGYVEVLARVDLKANGNTASVCLSSTGIPSQQIMSTASLTFETLHTLRGSTAGTTTEANVEWLPFFVTPGVHTISLFGGHTGGNTGTFENTTLLVRAIS